MFEIRNSKDLRDRQRAFVAGCFACAGLAAGFGVESISDMKPIPQARIEHCGQAIGQRAIYRDQKPKPECDGQVGIFINIRDDGNFKPTTASSFVASAESHNNTLGDDGIGFYVGIIGFTALGGVAGIAGFEGFDPAKSHVQRWGQSAVSAIRSLRQKV